MAKPKERRQIEELSSAFRKKADQELKRLKETVAVNLREEMLSLLEDEIHADLLITNGTTGVMAHKCIVQARCRHLWQNNWLSLGTVPDSSDMISCLKMSGLSRDKLMQFVRQLYSVSDSVLLLEDYLENMPGRSRSSLPACEHPVSTDHHTSATTEDSTGSCSSLPACEHPVSTDHHTSATTEDSTGSCSSLPAYEHPVSTEHHTLATTEDSTGSCSSLPAREHPVSTDHHTSATTEDSTGSCSSLPAYEHPVSTDHHTSATTEDSTGSCSSLPACDHPVSTDHHTSATTEDSTGLCSSLPACEHPVSTDHHTSATTEDSIDLDFQIKLEKDTSSSDGEVQITDHNDKTVDLNLCQVEQKLGGDICQNSVDNQNNVDNQNSVDNQTNVDNTLTSQLVYEGSLSTVIKEQLSTVSCSIQDEQYADVGYQINEKLQVILDRLTPDGGIGKSDVEFSPITDVNVDSCSFSPSSTRHVFKGAATSSDQMMTSQETARTESAFNSQDTSLNSCREKELSGLKLVTDNADVGEINKDLLTSSVELRGINVPAADDEQNRHLSSDKNMLFACLMTSESIPASYQTCSPLGTDLLNMYAQQANCDCCLSVDGVHFMAHKCILSARSEYFLAMFGGQWSESQMAAVNLEAVSPQAVRQLLLFLYGGVIDLSSVSYMKELFLIADMYGVLTFRTVLIFYVKRDLCHFFHKPCSSCSVTISEVLVLCQNFYLEELQTLCLKWMAKYFAKIWPTKSFSMLDDSLHQMCFDCILAQITTSNVLDIVFECTKLISSLPRIKWTENVLYLITRLMDTAIEYTSSHFVEVLKTQEFLHWAKVASWKASALEDIFYSVIDSLSVDTACLVFVTLMKLQEFHSNPETPEPEIAGLLEAMIRRCEKFFKTHIHQVTRSREWSMLPQPVQTRLLEISAYVYLQEPDVNLFMKQHFIASDKVKSQKTDRTLSVVGSGSRIGAAPARAGVPIRTSPSSGRRTGKTQVETRVVAKSLPGSNWSGSRREQVPVRSTGSIKRAGSEQRLKMTSSSQLSLASEGDRHCPELASIRNTDHKPSSLKGRNSGAQSLSQLPKSGTQSNHSVVSGASHDSLNKIKIPQRETETTHGGFLRTEPSWRYSFPPQLRSDKLLPLGQQKSQISLAEGNIRKGKLSPTKHFSSKLPTLIRSQRSLVRHETDFSTGGNVSQDMPSENINQSMVTSIDPVIHLMSQVREGHVAVDRHRVSVQDRSEEEDFSEVLQKGDAEDSYLQLVVCAGIELICTSTEDSVGMQQICTSTDDSHASSDLISDRMQVICTSTEDSVVSSDMISDGMQLICTSTEDSVPSSDLISAGIELICTSSEDSVASCDPISDGMQQSCTSIDDSHASSDLISDGMQQSCTSSDNQANVNQGNMDLNNLIDLSKLNKDLSEKMPPITSIAVSEHSVSSCPVMASVAEIIVACDDHSDTSDTILTGRVGVDQHISKDISDSMMTGRVGVAQHTSKDTSDNMLTSTLGVAQHTSKDTSDTTLTSRVGVAQHTSKVTSDNILTSRVGVAHHTSKDTSDNMLTSRVGGAQHISKDTSDNMLTGRVGVAQHTSKGTSDNMLTSRMGVAQHTNKDTSDSTLTSRGGVDQHTSKDSTVREIQPQVRVVHMSKTLNVGFIVPAD